jgi:hypothetical protein
LECDKWVFGLYSLLSSDVLPTVSLAHWLRNTWDLFDTRKEDKLNLDQVVQLFKRLNIRLYLREIKSAFKVYPFLTLVEYKSIQEQRDKFRFF